MRISIIHTREICYYSGEFFLRRMEEALESIGCEVEYLELSHDDEDEITAAGLTAVPASKVNAPLIKECFLNLECELEWAFFCNNFFILIFVTLS